MMQQLYTVHCTLYSVNSVLLNTQISIEMNRIRFAIGPHASKNLNKNK